MGFNNKFCCCCFFARCILHAPFEIMEESSLLIGFLCLVNALIHVHQM